MIGFTELKQTSGIASIVAEKMRGGDSHYQPGLCMDRVICFYGLPADLFCHAKMEGAKKIKWISFIFNELGEEREQYFYAVSPPIIQTSNFAFKRVADLRQAFEDEMSAIYTAAV
ncbi:MAG: hypothetical protein ABI813_16355 [Bacteroidota bacterium]